MKHVVFVCRLRSDCVGCQNQIREVDGQLVIVGWLQISDLVVQWRKGEINLDVLNSVPHNNAFEKCTQARDIPSLSSSIEWRQVPQPIRMIGSRHVLPRLDLQEPGDHHSELIEIATFSVQDTALP